MTPADRPCPACRRPAPPGAACPHCGATPGRVTCWQCLKDIPAECMICPFCEEPVRRTRRPPDPQAAPPERPRYWVPSAGYARVGGLSLAAILGLAALAGGTELAAAAITVIAGMAVFFLLLVTSERRSKPPIYGPEWYPLATLEIIGVFAASSLLAVAVFSCAAAVIAALCLVLEYF